MSTRANIKIKDNTGELWFYRHCDGYPEGTLPLLDKFVSLIKEKKIRDNVSQAGGWLILLGAQEEDQSVEKLLGERADWKVGSIEPTTGQHGDIEYLYEIDLITRTITYSTI